MADYPSTEGLIIEIESDATNAVEELEKLTTRLETFKSVVSSARPLATFSKNFKQLNDAIAKSTVIDGGKIAAIGQFAESVNKLNGISINSSLGNQLQRLGEVGGKLSTQQVNNIFNMTQALVNMSALEGFSFPQGLVKGLEKVANFATTIEGRDFSKLNELVTIITQMYSVSGESSKNITELTKSLKNMAATTKSASSHGKTFNTVLANIRTRTLGVYMIIRRLTRVAQTGMETYGDYIETLNLFSVSMENAGEEAYAFAEKCQYLLGIDLTQWMKAQGVFMSLGKGFGVATDRAALMSQQLTQLAYDISSFYNISVEDAIQKVQSGFSGQIKPMRQLGYDLSVAKLEAIALSLGIDKSVKSMTQAEKSQLRYIAMLTQVKDVQGDLARTLDSPVNQMRILQAQIQQMYRSLGQLLLPILNQILPYLMAIVKVVKMIMDEIAQLFGYVLPTVSGTAIGNGLSADIDDLTDDLGDATAAAEELKNTLASFDEINLIGSKSGSGSGSGGSLDNMLGDAFNFDLPTYDFLGDATENRAQKIADIMMNKIRPALEVIKDIIRWIRDNWEDIQEILEILAVKVIAMKLADGLTKCLNLSKEMTDRLNRFLSGGIVMVVGFQLSYLGGKDIAQGDFASGLLKSIGGMIASAAGGYVVAGVPGLVIGVTLGLVFSVKGYLDEKQAQFVKEVEDLFFKVDDARQNMSEFVKGWQDFTGSLFDSNVIEKATAMQNVSKSIDTVATSISKLKANYDQGLIDTDEYIKSMEEAFKNMADLVDQYFSTSADVILTGLEGALGSFLLSMGFTSEQIQEMMGKAKEELGEDVNDVVNRMAQLREELDQGRISSDYYNTELEKQVEVLKQYLNISDLASESVSDFSNSVAGLNFDSYDTVLEAITQINQAFEDSRTKLTTERDTMIEAMERIGEMMPEEYKERWRSIIDSTNDYYNEQEKKLVSGYQDAMDRIENQAFENWDKVFDTYGFEDAVDILKDGMTTMDEAIRQSYAKEGIERHKTAFQDAMQAIEKFGEVSDATGTTLISVNRDVYENGLKYYEQKAREVRDRYATIHDDMGNKVKEYESVYKSYTDKVKAYMQNQINSTENLTSEQKDELNKQMGLYNDLLGHASSTLPKIPQELANMAKSSRDVLINNQNPFYQNAVALVNKIGGAFYDRRDDAKNKIRELLIRSNDVIGSNEIRQLYYTKSTALMDRVKAGISDQQDAVKERVRQMLDNAKNVDTSSFTTKGKELRDKLLGGYTDTSGIQDKVSGLSKFMKDTFNGSSFYSTGKGIGNYLTDGLRDTEGELEGATKEVTRRMAKPFDDFGSDLYDYMNDMGAGIKDIWNSLEISAGSASFSKGRIAKWKIRGFASGGFPDSGEMFMANENGVAEYIGSMNGKAAVANNAEIIKGVSDGVYKALKNSGIVGDVKTIANKSGEVVFAPSEEAGRVIQQSVTKYNSTGGRY